MIADPRSRRRMDVARYARRATLVAFAALALGAPASEAAVVELGAPYTQSGFFDDGPVGKIALGQSNVGASPNDLVLAYGRFGGSRLQSRISNTPGDWRMGLPILTSIQEISTGGQVSDIALGDVNADGNLDIAASTLGGAGISRGFVTGIYGAFATAAGSPPETLAGVALAPVNADPLPDMLVAGPVSVDVYLNTGNATTPFNTRIQYNAMEAPTGLDAGDIDADGDQDVVTSSGAMQRAVVALNNGAGAFTAARSAGLFTRPGAVIAADVTGDARKELIVTEPDRDDVAIVSTALLPAALGPVTRIPTGVAPTDVVAADLDGDGKREIIVANAASDSITVAEPGGASRDFPAGPTPVSLAISEVSGDNLPDVVVLNDSVFGVSVLRNLGVAVPAAPSLPIAPIAPVRSAKLKCSTRKSAGKVRRVTCAATLTNLSEAKKLTARLLLRGRTVARASATPGKSLTFNAKRGFKAGKYEARLIVANLDGTTLTAKKSITVR